MLKRWVKKAEWEEWFPPASMACFLTKQSFENYRDTEWGLTKLYYETCIQEEKPTC